MKIRAPSPDQLSGLEGQGQDRFGESAGPTGYHHRQGDLRNRETCSSKGV